jgi:hypothetical protein
MSENKQHRIIITIIDDTNKKLATITGDRNKIIPIIAQLRADNVKFTQTELK